MIRPPDRLPPPHGQLVLGPERGLVVVVLGPAVRRRLHPAEERVASALPAARRADFVSGRRAAAVALGLLGRTGPVLRADDGRPLFPSGVLGSLSHCDGYGVCAVALRGPCPGVDLEREGRVPDLGLGHVGTPDEIAWTRQRPELAAHRRTALFCAKEAVFKVRDGADGGRRGHLGVELLPRPGGFAVRRPAGLRVTVRRFEAKDGTGHLLALVRGIASGGPLGTSDPPEDLKCPFAQVQLKESARERRSGGSHSPPAEPRVPHPSPPAPPGHR